METTHQNKSDSLDIFSYVERLSGLILYLCNHNNDKDVFFSKYEIGSKLLLAELLYYNLTNAFLFCEQSNRYFIKFEGIHPMESLYLFGSLTAQGYLKTHLDHSTLLYKTTKTANIENVLKWLMTKTCDRLSYEQLLILLKKVCIGDCNYMISKFLPSIAEKSFCTNIDISIPLPSEEIFPLLQKLKLTNFNSKFLFDSVVIK